MTTEVLDDGHVTVVTFDPDAEWDHSEFPEPLITSDYDAGGRVFRVVIVGAVSGLPCSNHIVADGRRFYCEQGQEGHWGTCYGEKPESTYRAEVDALTRHRAE